MTELQLKASDLLRRFPLVDGHNDLPWALRERSPDGLAAVDLAGAVIGTHTDLPRLARGWSESDCAALAGGNLLRVLREAESFAARG